jgi:hypothetical protein
MRQRTLIGALGLVLIGVILGATVFRSDIAQATGLAQAVTVANTPLPVREQNLDADGNVKVHEQGVVLAVSRDFNAILLDRQVTLSNYIDCVDTHDAKEIRVFSGVNRDLFIGFEDQDCNVIGGQGFPGQNSGVIELPSPKIKIIGGAEMNWRVVVIGRKN